MGAVVSRQGPPLNVVGGLFGGKALAIGVAEADFQAVAHAVARLGHRLFTWSARRFSLLYEGTLYHLDVYSTAAQTGRSSAALSASCLSAATAAAAPRGACTRFDARCKRTQ